MALANGEDGKDGREGHFFPGTWGHPTSVIQACYKRAISVPQACLKRAFSVLRRPGALQRETTSRAALAIPSSRSGWAFRLDSNLPEAASSLHHSTSKVPEIGPD